MRILLLDTRYHAEKDGGNYCTLTSVRPLYVKAIICEIVLSTPYKGFLQIKA